MKAELEGVRKTGFFHHIIKIHKSCLIIRLAITNWGLKKYGNKNKQETPLKEFLLFLMSTHNILERTFGAIFINVITALKNLLHSIRVLLHQTSVQNKEISVQI